MSALLSGCAYAKWMKQEMCGEESNGEVTDISLVSYQASHPWSSTNVATQSGVGRYRAGLCREAWRWGCTILVHAD
ncbi:hypothetical protein FOTG_13950 [Fusarium oxysporum f. sp. vasinfectum 25433]|uniref:Uncharacterized protein n=1 Tax=Fusarium oxysporum f. sp. vasinfectum 25433 TaxID=1089449 RepID=X0LAF6_FUSOX|nr:hypothetical protein FOTG_13950 [Fusarium oxysporum f. sp. vasinfectum 25433]